MSENVLYGFGGMRFRCITSLLLIAFLTISFVFLLSKYNRDISNLNDLSLKSSNLNATLKSVLVSAERIRFPQTLEEETAHFENIELLNQDFETQLIKMRLALDELTIDAQQELTKLSNVQGDPFWAFQDFQHRLEELLAVRNVYMPNGKSQFSDFKNKLQTIDAKMPYLEPINRVLAVNSYLIKDISQLQTQYVAQRLGGASRGIKNSTILFMGLGGGLLFLVYFLIYLPMEKLITQQLVKLKIANKEVKIADHAKSEFLANMSHEVRTPMNGIMGMAELLQKTRLDDRQKTFIEVILRSGNSLLTIINDILDFSKIDAGMMKLMPEPFILSQAVEEVAGLVYPKVAEKDIELTVRIEPNLPDMFVGDVGRIRQIITNLLSNAVKFTENGYVRVNVSGHTKNELGYLRFEVSDSGIGIKPEKCEHIFKQFSQVDESSSRKHDGTGLGLTISSALVHLMGGEIKVRSKLGSGSTFSFEIVLPIHKMVVQSVNPFNVNINGAKVIIIDDNAVSAKILQENLEAWQFDAAVIENPSKAFGLISTMQEQNINVDCIILDFHIATMSAKKVIDKIRNNPNLADIPIILLTSLDHLVDGNHFLSLGIQAHLVKPLQTRILRGTVTRVIHESRTAIAEARQGIAMVRKLIGSDQNDSDDKNSAVAHVEAMRDYEAFAENKNKATKQTLLKSKLQYAGRRTLVDIHPENRFA